ncbi:MAG: hypothetical protein HYX84_02445 [Chloroflexi bacterium]|nr:hypothetical protein [Chloroflexota bacterium]
MPGKSRHKKARRLPQGGRGKAGAPQPAPAAVVGTETVRAAAPVARPRATTAPTGVATPAQIAAPVHTYIGRELRNIIILGSVILAAVIVVALLTR